MSDELILKPEEIEKRSFEIITEEMGDRAVPALHAPIVKRVIHATADFSYLESLCFTEGAVERGIEALSAGASILTDTNMALAGINKAALQSLSCKAFCYMAERDVAEQASAKGTTRAVASMDKACGIEGPLIVAVGNAPTALLRLCELIEAKKLKPDLIIGVPVGFVNVVESKEAILKQNVPCIVARGRKGGSTVAAAICNALLYSITRKEIDS